MREHMFAAILELARHSVAQERVGVRHFLVRTWGTFPEHRPRPSPRANRDFSGRSASVRYARVSQILLAVHRSRWWPPSCSCQTRGLLLTMREPSESRRPGSDIPYSTRPTDTRDRCFARWPWAQPTVL